MNLILLNQFDYCCVPCQHFIIGFHIIIHQLNIIDEFEYLFVPVNISSFAVEMPSVLLMAAVRNVPIVCLLCLFLRENKICWNLNFF